MVYFLAVNLACWTSDLNVSGSRPVDFLLRKETLIRKIVSFHSGA